jgi:hypothetical protein
MRQHWRLTLAATVTLGLGIGSALTMAGIVEHVLLLIALAAILAASRSAARTHPMVVLRAE